MKQPLKIILQIFAAVYGSIGGIILWSKLPEWLGNPKISDTFWYKATEVLFLVTLFGVPIFLSLKMAWKPMMSFLALSGKKKEAFAKGRHATATVLEIDESILGTVSVNDQPYVRMKLKVNDSGKEPYVVTIESIIPRLSVPSFQPGCMVNVLIDPENPEKVLLDL